MAKRFKSGLIIVISIFFISNCAGTQDLAPDGSKIPHDVNTIIVDTDKTVDEAFSAIGKHLVQQGFNIKNSSPEFKNVTTEFKKAKSGALQANVDINISATVVQDDENSNIILSGKLRSSVIGESEIMQKGQGGSVMRVAWDEFYSFAKSYSDNLSFENR